MNPIALKYKNKKYWHTSNPKRLIMCQYCMEVGKVKHHLASNIANIHVTTTYLLIDLPM
jgi:hypothetical protein